MLHFIIYLFFAFNPISDTTPGNHPDRPGDGGRDGTEIIIKDDMGG